MAKKATTEIKKRATKSVAPRSTIAKKTTSATKAARPVGNASYSKRQNQILDGKAPTRTGISPKKALETERAAELARSRRKGTNAMKSEVRANNNYWNPGKATASDARRLWNYEQKYTK